VFKNFLVCLTLVASHIGLAGAGGPPEKRIELCQIEVRAGVFGFNGRENGATLEELKEALKEMKKQAEADGIPPEVIFHALRGVEKAYHGAGPKQIFDECMTTKET
jgi:hypothetical protein